MDARSNGYGDVHLGTLVSVVHPAGHAYSVNVATTKQQNARTQYTRDVKIVEAASSTAHQVSIYIL